MEKINREKRNMKNFIWFVSMGFVIVGCLFVCFNNRSEFNKKEEYIESMNLEMELIAYYHAIQFFKELSPEQAEEKIREKSPFFLFVGRDTCQSCRKVIQPLQKAVSQLEIEMFYLNSEKTDDNLLLSQFREDYHIDFVPAIIFFDRDGQVYHMPKPSESLDYEQLTTYFLEEFNKLI